MKIYILTADVNNYRTLFYTEKGMTEFMQRFNGTPMKKIWTGKEGFRFDEENQPKGDTPGLGGNVLVFSPRAVSVLGDLLKGNGELLPITCEGEEYFLFNVTRLVDALDEANCDLERFDDGRIIDIDRYSFIEEKLIGVTVFKLAQDPLGWVYCTDPFADRVRTAGLKGFKFRLVWSEPRRTLH